MTVVTTTRLRPGAEQDWDRAVRERFESAHGRPGWVSGQLLTPELRAELQGSFGGR